MKHPPVIALVGMACLFASCEKKESPAPVAAQSVNYTTPGAQWASASFTPWMTRAGLQYFQNTSPSDQYFAHVEGRNNGGHLEYRAVVMPFTGDDYVQWAVFWGIDEGELFKCEMNLLSNGFVSQDTQIFADETGKAIHQIVWLKPKPHTDDPPRNADTEEPVASPLPEPMPEPVPQAVPPAESGLVDANPVDEAPVARRVAEEHAKADSGPAGTDAPTPKIPKGPVYVVQQGDTLGKIAKNRKVGVAELKTLNHLKSDVLRIGQKLVIPTKAK